MQHLTIGTRLENQLLICVARRSVDTVTAERIHLLVQQELDWNYLLDSANRNGLTPLLYWHLSPVRSKAVVPEEISRRLRNEFVINRAWAVFLTSELLRIIKVLENNRISAAGFKGPILSLSAYGDIALRQAGDLDILIERGDFGRAKALLDSEGYAMDPQLTAAQQAAHVRSNCEIPFIHADSGCVVDLHWELAPKWFFALNSADLFRRLQTITFGNNTVRTLSSEVLLVFLCMHGAKHLWSRIEWISSLAELVRNSEGIDWTTVVEQARRSHSLRMLLLGLMLARDLQPDIEIPAPVLAAAPDSEALERCLEGIREKLFQIRAQGQSDIVLFNLAVMDRKRDAVAGLLRSVLVPTISDWQFVNLPNALYPLYYILRPLRLVGKYSSALGKRIRLARGDPAVGYNDACH